MFILLTLHEVLNDTVTEQNCKKKWLYISQCMCKWLPVRTKGGGGGGRGRGGRGGGKGKSNLSQDVWSLYQYLN